MNSPSLASSVQHQPSMPDVGHPAPGATRVMVVDDERGVRATLRVFLQAEGYEVEMAEDAAQAQALLSKGGFDVVITDIVLPGISGVELLKTIRAASPDVQVIMMTGEPTTETAAEAVRAGAFDYLIKPVDKSAILRAVGNAAKIKAIEDQRRELERANTRYRETLEAKVMELKEEVEHRKRAEQAKDDFVSMVSHDLRTPLAIAKEAFSLLADGSLGALTADQQRILDITGLSMERLADLIDDLLDVARIDAGKLVLEKERIDLVALARQVCTLLEPLAAGKGVTIEVCSETATLWVLADRQRMFQALMNLGGNAVKFTEQGGVRIELYEDGREGVVDVRDTGMGISPVDIPLVFDRFPRLKRVYRLGQKGTGLGLSIVKVIVTMHGGTIAVRSEEGKGSVFTVRLPKGDFAESV